MASFEFLAIILTGLGLMVSIIYYAMVLRSQNQTRQAQLFMQVINQWNQQSMTDAWSILENYELNSVDDAMRHAEENPEMVKAFRTYLNWLESIGVLVKEGYLDIKIIAELLSIPVKISWKKWEPIIMHVRQTSSPRQYIEFEYLYNALMKYYEEHPELVAP